jgi:methylmalonyl-CoA/ethylmalonyl-CoA epimerase
MPAMKTDPIPTASFGEIRQLGYVVRDIKHSVRAWSSRLGVGPWTIIRNIPLHSVYLGQPSEPLIDIALAYRGAMQIELIQQKNDAPSPYWPYIEYGDFGLHHTAFLSAQIDRDVQRAKDAGLHLACDINMPTGGRYVYFDAAIPEEHGYIELIEATPALLEMFDQGMKAAASWDGHGEPVVIEFADLVAGR